MCVRIVHRSLCNQRNPNSYRDSKSFRSEWMKDISLPTAVWQADEKTFIWGCFLFEGKFKWLVLCKTKTKFYTILAPGGSTSYLAISAFWAQLASIVLTLQLEWKCDSFSVSAASIKGICPKLFWKMNYFPIRFRCVNISIKER